MSPRWPAVLAALLLTLSAPPGRALRLPWPMQVVASRLGIRALAGDAAPAQQLVDAANDCGRDCCGADCEPSPPLPIEATLTADELIRHWGYPSEVHNIQTEDGYILTVHRIPWGRSGRGGPGDKPGDKPVVFLQHGLLQASDQWLLRGPDQDLVLMLADLGYDVWLGNYRGNAYSRRHVSLTTNNEKYWDFSWHENGFYDLAAELDYALGVTGQPSLYYIGHSMGTTTLLVLLSARPEYNSRIRQASLLAPVVYFQHPRGLMASALPVSKKFERDLRASHVEVLPLGTVPLTLMNSLCHPGAATYNLCVAVFMQVAGPDRKQLNETLFTTILAHLPAGGSLGQFVHFAQVYKTGQFRQYDHGVRLNTRLYGRSQPPLYNLTNVVAPIVFYYATGDYLSDAKDVERLISEVPGTAAVFKVPDKKFNHADYLWGTNSYELLYKTVLKTLRDF